MSPTSRSPGAQLSGRRHAPAGRVSRPGGHRAVWSAGSRVTARPANQAHASNPRPVPRCTHTPRGSAGPAPVGLPGPVEHLRDPRPHDPPPDTGRSLGSVAPGSGFSSATGGSRPPSPAPEPDPPAPHTPAHRPANSLTHLFSVLRSTPRSPATSVIVRPDRTTICTASARNCALNRSPRLARCIGCGYRDPGDAGPGGVHGRGVLNADPGYGGREAAGCRAGSDSAGDCPGLDRLRSAGRARRH